MNINFKFAFTVYSGDQKILININGTDMLISLISDMLIDGENIDNNRDESSKLKIC